MSITIDQIILDAQRIAGRVKDLEALGNALLVEAEANNRQIETMKQFQDDVESLNKLARNKTNADMVNRINQQSPSSREIRQENRELKATLEDHQRALELIMHKYREHTQNKITSSRVNFKELCNAKNAKMSEVIRNQGEKITEMAAVMQKAAAMDDETIHKEIECINRLRIENQGLRELLQISNQFGSIGMKINHEDKSIQTEESLLNPPHPLDTAEEKLSNLTVSNDNTERMDLNNKNDVTFVLTNNAKKNNDEDDDDDDEKSLNSSNSSSLNNSVINNSEENCSKNGINNSVTSPVKPKLKIKYTSEITGTIKSTKSKKQNVSNNETTTICVNGDIGEEKIVPPAATAEVKSSSSLPNASSTNNLVDENETFTPSS